MATPLALDTSLDIERKQIEQWRRMSPADKAAIVSGLTNAVREMALAGIRHRYPNATAHEQHLRLGILLLGKELARKAYPEISTLEEP